MIIVHCLCELTWLILTSFHFQCGLYKQEHWERYKSVFTHHSFVLVQCIWILFCIFGLQIMHARISICYTTFVVNSSHHFYYLMALFEKNKYDKWQSFSLSEQLLVGKWWKEHCSCNHWLPFVYFHLLDCQTYFQIRTKSSYEERIVSIFLLITFYPRVNEVFEYL